MDYNNNNQSINYQFQYVNAAEDVFLTKEEMAIIDACKGYPYKGKKNMKAFVMSIIVLIILICITVYMVIGAYNDLPFENMMFAGSGAILILFAYIYKKFQLDAMKILTQYFRDETGMYYKVQFTKVCAQVVKIHREYSLIPLVGEVKTLLNSFRAAKEKDGYMEEAYADAQSKILAYYYVKRYKQGYKDWNAMNGGPAKVIPLGYLKHISGTKYQSMLNGKTKNIKVKEVYGKIAD